MKEKIIKIHKSCMKGTGNHKHPSAIKVNVKIDLVEVLIIRVFAKIIAKIEPIANESIIYPTPT